jgi:hypothetical protein
MVKIPLMVVRDHPVENFGFDDADVKTLGLGRKNGTNVVSQGTVDPI